MDDKASTSNSSNTEGEPALNAARSSGRAWWRDVDVLVLVAFVVLVYFVPMTELTIRGEEPRRAQVAVEILRTGDWIVPRQQGQIYTSRPPAGSWPIAWMAMLRGKMDVTSVRLPTVIAVLMTVLLIYGYARQFLTRAGAFVAAIAYPSMMQVLHLGRVAETEGVFTLWLAGSLLIWHWGYMRGWSMTLTWCVGGALAVMAGLTKGTQGPVYFYAGTWFFLVLRRDWRWLFSVGNVVGLLVFAGLLSLWQAPYLMRTDWPTTRAIWLGLASDRFDTDIAAILKHMATYPLAILVATLPWSALLPRLLHRQFWQESPELKSPMVFLLASLIAAFPSVWLAPGAVARYFMPLYPMIAVLAAIALERSWRTGANPFGQKAINLFWRSWAIGAALITAFFVVAGMAASRLGASIPGLASLGEKRWAQETGLPAHTVLALIGLAIPAVIVLWRLPRWRVGQSSQLSGASKGEAIGVDAQPEAATPGGFNQGVAMRAGAMTLAVFIAFCWAGLMTDIRVRLAEDHATAIAKLKTELPTDVELVSLGTVHHLFRFHYQKPIRWLPNDGGVKRGDAPDFDYFCFNAVTPIQRELPFKWKQVALVSMERGNQPREAMSVVVIGRRLKK